MKPFLFVILYLFFGCTATKNSTKPTTDQRLLKDVYKDAFLMGVAVSPAITTGSDKASQDIVTKHFNSITVENVMKAALINPQPGVYHYGPADEYVAFGQKIRCSLSVTHWFGIINVRRGFLQIARANLIQRKNKLKD